MNIDKAKKRIAKHVKKGFKGYPLVTIEYVGKSTDSAHGVIVNLTLEEGADPQTQKLSSSIDARNDETIQSTLVKIIERTETVSVTESSQVSVLK